MIFFRKEIAHFIHSMRKALETGVLLICKLSQVSSRTYYKIMRYEAVKDECYYRLFVGFCRAMTVSMFMKHWEVLGSNLYWQYTDS